MTFDEALGTMTQEILDRTSDDKFRLALLSALAALQAIDGQQYPSLGYRPQDVQLIKDRFIQSVQILTESEPHGTKV